MARNNRYSQDIEGLFIYHDDKGRSVFSNPFMKNGYVIKRSDFRQYTVYSTKSLIALAIGTLPYLFVKNWYICIVVGLVAYAVLTAMFHFKYLPSCTKIENFVKPKREGFIERNVRSQPLSQILISMGLSFLFVVALIYNLIQMKFQGIELVLYWLLIAVAAAYFILNCVLFTKKQVYEKNRK